VTGLDQDRQNERIGEHSHPLILKILLLYPCVTGSEQGQQNERIGEHPDPFILKILLLYPLPTIPIDGIAEEKAHAGDDR